MVFNVKFDLRQKARLVAGRNHTVPPKEDIFSGVVGMESIHLGFLLAAMNGLNVCTANIGNASRYGRMKEKVYIIAGKEFGELHGEKLIIDKGLYGLHSSRAHFHKHLSQKLWLMGCTHQRPALTYGSNGAMTIMSILPPTSMMSFVLEKTHLAPSRN